jgi:hypothetical protein
MKDQTTDQGDVQGFPKLKVGVKVNVEHWRSDMLTQY